MPGRALWKGVITFGGVTVPVKLFTVFQDTRTHFNLLHDQDGVRLRQEMWDPVENVPVHREHQVKGYEISGGEYVIVTEDELDALQPEEGRDIEVMDFVSAGEIDLRYYNHAYYLGPDGSERIYADLAAAISETGHIGICKWVMRKKQYLGALTLSGGVLSLITIHHADEIDDIESLDIPESKPITKQERETGQYLVESLTVPFDPEKYVNEYDHNVMQFILERAKGKTISSPGPKKKEQAVSDNLLETLKASIEQAKEKK